MSDDDSYVLDEHDDERAWWCADCGQPWDPGEHPATRLSPAEVDRPECPACGGPRR